MKETGNIPSEPCHGVRETEDASPNHGGHIVECRVPPFRVPGGRDRKPIINGLVSSILLLLTIKPHFSQQIEETGQGYFRPWCRDDNCWRALMSDGLFQRKTSKYIEIEGDEEKVMGKYSVNSWDGFDVSVVKLPKGPDFSTFSLYRFD